MRATSRTPAVPLTLATAALALLAGRAYGQQVLVGARAAWHSSTVATGTAPNGDTLEGVGRRSTIGGGVTLELQGRRFFASTGLSYSPHGFEAQPEPGAPAFQASIKYLEIPVHLGIRFPRTSSLTPRAWVGPWLAWEIGCALEGEAQGTSISIDCDDPGEGLTERQTTDWGLAFGGGIELAGPGRTVLLAGVQYRLGIRNLDTAEDFENVNARSRAFTIAVGAALPVGVR